MVVFGVQLGYPLSVWGISPSIKLPFNIVSEGDSFELFYLPEYSFLRELPELVNLANPRIIKMIEEECLSPKVIIQVILTKNLIIDEEEVKVTWLTSLEYSLGLSPVTVVQIIYEQEIHLRVPS